MGGRVQFLTEFYRASAWTPYTTKVRLAGTKLRRVKTIRNVNKYDKTLEHDYSIGS